MLDQFANAYDQEAAPQPNEGRDLPTTFGESFSDSWANGQLAVSGVKQANARDQAVSEYIGQIKQAGGDYDSAYASEVSASGGGDATYEPDALGVANDVVAGMQAKGVKLPFKLMTSDDIDARSAQISRQAIAVQAENQGREQTFGSRVGGFLGSAASATADPYNIPLMALPVEGLGILGTAAAFGLGSAATQAANEAVNSSFNERVQPGYGASGQALGNIAEAGASGAVLGGGVKALGNVLTRLATGAWPTAAKDAANGVMSEANILQSNEIPGSAERAAAPVEPPSTPPAEPEIRTPSQRAADMANAQADADAARTRTPSERQIDTDTNVGATVRTPSEREAGEPGRVIEPQTQVLPGAEGEAAHSEALGKSIDQVLKGDPVDVSDAVPPDSDFASRIGDLPTELPSSEGSPSPEPEPPGALPGTNTADDMRAAVAAPEAQNAMRADVERAIDEAAQGGKALQIPVDIDANGEPIMGSVTSALGEIDRYNELADQVAACALPGAMQEAAE